MPNPHPLTLCPAAKIDFSNKSAPEAIDYGDIYFSTDGGSEETKTIFLKACGLPERWADIPYFAIGELGFGTGLNFLETLQLWEETTKTNTHQRLHYISIEKHPLDKIQLWESLKFWPGNLSVKMSLVKNWPGRVKGFHNLDFDNVRLTLIHDDVGEALSQIQGQIDAWFLDGFSPSKNPDMWSPEVMAQLSRLSRVGTRLGTFTVARKVRDGLSQAGFLVEKKKGFGRKRDRLEAVFPGRWDIPAKPDIKPIIIGAGIAGASLAHSFLSRGIIPTIIDPSDGSAASGNPSAIIKPRLDLQDRPESRFFLSSYLYALNRYQNLQCVLENTVVHKCPTVKEQNRYEKLLAQSVLPEDHFTKLESSKDFIFPEAVIIDPSMARRNSQEGAPLVKGSAGYTKQGNIFDPDENILATGTHIFWTCGFGIRALPQFAHLNLRYSRGQLSWIKGALQMTTTFGGYGIPLDGQTLVGATHKRLDDQSPFESRHEDDRENLERFEKAMGVHPLPADTPSRSSVRVTTASTLPVIFNYGDEWGLTGLGSRGFVFAPLLAEAMVSQICGEVLPISNKVWARFQAREKAHPESAP